MILIEGYLENIELVGRLRIGDLIVDGSGTASSLWMSLDCDVYGRVRLINDAFWFTVGTSGPTRLRPGAHVTMGGNRNMVVISGGTLQLDHGSMIGRTSAQEVEVLNTSTLQVLPGCKTSIDAMVRVMAGGTFVVEDSAVVFIRDLVVEAGGAFIVKPGAHVLFGADDVEIDGYFTAVGNNTNDKRIVFSTEVSPNCVFDMRNHDHLETRCRIHATGSPLDIPASLVQVSVTDFKNVSLELTDIRKTPIFECHFSSDRTSPPNGPDNVWTTQPFMLTHQVTTLPLGAPPDYLNLIVQNSWFVDSGAAVPIINNYTPPANRYIICGLRTTTTQALQVTGCYFERLKTGIFTSFNVSSTITYTGFRDGDEGIIANGGRVFTCNDTSNIVEYPMSLRYAEPGTHVDNKFNMSRIAVNLLASNIQTFRNNLFNDYFYGIENNASISVLTSFIGPASSTEIYGRNRFEVPDPAPFNMNPPAHPNVFMRRPSALVYGADVMQLSDLIVANQGVFALTCGYNAFSIWATNHIARFIGPPVAAVDFSTNNCRPLSAIRFNNVAVLGAPLNQSQTLLETCITGTDPETCSPYHWFYWSGGFGKHSELQIPWFTADIPPDARIPVSKSALDAFDSRLTLICGADALETPIEIFSMGGEVFNVQGTHDVHKILNELANGVYFMHTMVNGRPCKFLLTLTP